MAQKVGVIGAGSMGQNHIRVLLGMDSENEVFAYDPVARELDSPRAHFVPSIAELVASGIDYAVVATPSHTHFQLATQLAISGVPTLIEKPVTLNLADAVDLEESFRSNNTFAAVGHVERFNSAFALMREKIAEGLVGEVAKIATSRTGPYSGRIQDVGVIFDLASHDVDLVTWLTSSGIEEFSAMGKSYLGLNNEDTLLVHGRLQGGQLFSHDINWLTPRKQREVSVIGSSGMLVASSVTHQLTFYSNQDRPHDWQAFRDMVGNSAGQSVSFEISVKEPLLAQHQAMQNELRGLDTQICTISEGVEVVKQLVDYKNALGARDF
jgi:predicted dehydrogenase